MKEHHYDVALIWTGNTGDGTVNYKAYTRDHEVSVKGKNFNLPLSSDPSFLGDKTRYNPEELFVASISSCHMLWYLHLCAVNKIVVVNYKDDASGLLEELPDGSGHFKCVTLNPVVTVKSLSMVGKANELHSEAHKKCFIANSVNFKVSHKSRVVVTDSLHT